jgi:G3E family GTPase
VRTIVVAGFLGSGKTTVLLHLAKRLVADGKRVAVVENEIGEVGIDGKYVAELGLLVQELFGGCICCTLTVGLIDALEELARTYHPDYVLVEPTGIAQPAELAEAVREYSARTAHVSVITVLDAERYHMLSQVIGTLLEGQIAHADVVAVNKCDAVESLELRRILSDVAALAPHIPLVTLSEDDRSGLDSVLGAVL